MNPVYDIQKGWNCPMSTENITAAYRIAKEAYAAIGVDTETAMNTLRGIYLSLHCWQGDDVIGFEHDAGALTGGIMATGNYPGRAATPDELRDDLAFAMKLLPGPHKVNLHAIYLDTDQKGIDRDRIEPRHFENWAQWAKELGIGLDFNPTFFSHPKSADGFTLSSADEDKRAFWVEHGKRARRVGAYLGRETGVTCVTNIWIPDGYKDNPVDCMAPRERLRDSLDQILAEKFDPNCNLDAVESKLFGIGSEAYVTGSHEFYMGYAMEHRKDGVLLTLDAGHYHPTEVISAKIPALLVFLDKLLLHVSRPVRWDSDHVVLLDDELQAIMNQVVRCGALNRVFLALDYFDASINRIAAWVVGARNARKALLRALLEPTGALKKLEAQGDYTARLALTEEYKTYPFEAVWDYFCQSEGVPVREAWLAEVRAREKKLNR